MIIDRIHQWARTEPNKPALIHNGFIIDYITFAKAIEAFRKVLEQWHLPVGTIAVVLVGHLADAWALVMALRALGLTTIHVQSLVQANALLLKNVSCVVTTAREQLEYNLDRNPLPGAKLIVLSRNDLAATPVNDLRPSPPNDRPSGGHILYTSGTTGAYRKLLWDSEREEARSSERGRFQDFDKHTMAHILRCAQHTGIGWKIPLAVWQVGGCVVMDQRPERYEQLFRHSVTYVFMTPLMFRRLVATDRINPAASPNCDFRIGGGGVGSDLVTKALTRFGDTINLYHGYASSELAISALASRLRSGDDALWLEPVADRTVQIVDESGHECSLGQEGDLRVRTTELDWQSYLDDDEATARVFRDGFFYPGDRAVRRADGRIRVLGRVADVLNVQGDKVAVGPIEQRIKQYLDAEEVCAFSRRNSAGQDELVIAIQADCTPPKQKLDAISREFSGFEKVRFSVLREFPRTDTGMEKVHRIALRKLIFSEADSGASGGGDGEVFE